MGKPLLSIIVPVYNTEIYLEECLESICAQTLHEIEVICINDGSVDKSGQILEKFAQKDARIRVINQENEGLVKARKTGLKYARASVVGFVDSDDWVEKHMYESLYRAMTESGVDMISSGVIEDDGSFSFDGLSPGTYSSDDEDAVLYRKMLTDYHDGQMGLLANVWNKLYRRELLLHTSSEIPENIRFHEDDCLVFSYVLQCKTVKILHEAFYHYRAVATSMSRTADPLFLERIHSFYLFMKKEFGRSPRRDILLPRLDVYLSKTLLLGINEKMGLRAEAHVDAKMPCKILLDACRIVIYGTGRYGRQMKEYVQQFPDRRVVAFTDKNQENKSLDDIPVFAGDEIKDLAFDKIIVAVSDDTIREAVLHQLAESGIGTDRILDGAEVAAYRPSGWECTNNPQSKTIKVSVIVPVYNMENYIGQCVESLIGQSWKELEFICIDDGSTDDSAGILKKLADTDTRIRVIEKGNTGYGDTINCGIRLSEGEYIAILEADDFAEPEIYERLYRAGAAVNADVVKGNYNDYYSDTDRKIPVVYLPENQYDVLLEWEEHLVLYGPAIWAGIYKREFLLKNDIWVLESPGASYQDISFTFKAMLCAQRLLFIRDAVINYRKDNAGSSVRDCGKVFCVCNEIAEIQRFLEDGYWYELFPVFCKYKYDRYLWNLERLQGINKVKFLLKMREEFRRDSFQGYIVKGFWKDQEWSAIHKMIFDFSRFFRDLCKVRAAEDMWKHDSERDVFAMLSLVSPIYLYGAGKLAEKILKKMQKHCIRIDKILVSDKTDNPAYLDGIAVCEVRDDTHLDRNALIILGVSQKYRQEVKAALHARYYNNYICIDEF